jgi:ComF family protein
MRLAMCGWTGEAPGALCDRCGTSVGVGEADEFGCATCRDYRVPWDRAFRLGPYEDDLRAIILEVKFTRFRSAGMALGALLGKAIRDGGGAFEPVVVVPIPMSTRRRLARGIDHTAAIGRGASKELGAPMVMALARKHRPSQRTVSMSARSRNVAGTIRLRRGQGAGIKGRTVVLVDDVRTSGATLRAAARAIREGGAGCAPKSVWVATVGVTPGRGRKDLAGLKRNQASQG